MSDDMSATRRRLRRILRQLPQRFGASTGLSKAARLQLLAVVTSLARGGSFPTQAALAVQLETSVSTVGRALGELKATGLVVDGRTAHSPARWMLDVDQLEAWAGASLPSLRRPSSPPGSSVPARSVRLTDPIGQSDRLREESASLVVVGPAVAPADSRPGPSAQEGRNAVAPAEQAEPRPGARDSAAAGEVTPPREPERPPLSPRPKGRPLAATERATVAPLSPEDRALQRIIAACHRCSIRTPPVIQDELLSLYRSGVPIDEIIRACKESAIYGAFNLAYALAVVRDRGVDGWAVVPEAEDESEGNVIPFASHRKRGQG